MSQARKIPMRKCIGCQEMKSKKEMLRVIRTPEEELVIDTTGRKNGRGAYLCRQSACFEMACKNKGLERSLKMNITVGDRTLTATMEDNAAGRDFLSRLPLEVTLNDYNNTTEKIFYPGPALTTEGVTRGCAPTPGDITIYVPWGNVAIFCKSWSHSNDLIKIGRIDGDGIEALNIGGDIAVKFERQ